MVKIQKFRLLKLPLLLYTLEENKPYQIVRETNVWGSKNVSGSSGYSNNGTILVLRSRVQPSEKWIIIINKSELIKKEMGQNIENVPRSVRHLYPGHQAVEVYCTFCHICTWNKKKLQYNEQDNISKNSEIQDHFTHLDQHGFR